MVSGFFLLQVEDAGADAVAEGDQEQQDSTGDGTKLPGHVTQQQLNACTDWQWGVLIFFHCHAAHHHWCDTCATN